MPGPRMGHTGRRTTGESGQSRSQLRQMPKSTFDLTGQATAPPIFQAGVVAAHVDGPSQRRVPQIDTCNRHQRDKTASAPRERRRRLYPGEGLPQTPMRHLLSSRSRPTLTTAPDPSTGHTGCRLTGALLCIHSRGAVNGCQFRAGSGGSQGLPSMAARMASRAVMPWAAAESR